MQAFKHNKAKHHSLCNVGIVVLLFLCLLSFLTACDVYGIKDTGNYTVSGYVKDDNNRGVEGASISIKNSSIKTISGKDGFFKLENVPGQNVELVVSKGEKIFVPCFENNIYSNGNSINVDYSTDDWDVTGCNFIAVDEITISLIQGRSDISPLNGLNVDGVLGVVTQVCFSQAHNNRNFTTPDPSTGRTNPQVISEDGFYMQLLPNTSVNELKSDGDALTSDGIFVSTRNPKGKIGVSSWLPDCKPNNKYPKPGDIVRVSGIVDEYQKVDRFGESRGLKTRTQINATSVIVDTDIVSNGFVNISDENILQLTYSNNLSIEDKDSFRVVPFNDKGDGALERASAVFESCEGMLVRICNPIVIGATYYNTTPVLADGGLKDGKYPDQFNKKWLGNVVQENDFNTEVIYAYYDALEYDDIPPMWEALPQIGTVLNDDLGQKVFRGIMDYSDNGIYMVYPLRKYNLNTRNTSPANIDYSRFIDGVGLHDKFKFSLNDTAPAGSLYKFGSQDQKNWIHNKMESAQNAYKPWKSGVHANNEFVVPDTWTLDDNHINVAVFNLENYVAEGARYRKYNDVYNVLANNLKLPDLIFLVEMGDQDSSDSTIPYRNTSFSQNNLTGVVAARLNYETLIKKIKKETGVQYDYRQIDPVEYTQAGSPGNNIRVGFMFRTDRVEAYDLGLETIHMEGLPGSDYKIPEYLKDDHKSLIWGNGRENTSSKIKPGALESEPYLTLENKCRLADTQTEVLVEEYNDDGSVKSLTLSQSPGFLQDDRFYNSRLPLVCKFKFKPTGEDFFAIALHLYSKGRDDKLYGSIQPPVMTSEIRRAGQSAAVREFIDGILSLDPDAKIIVGGDVNDFGFTYPIRKMTGEGTENQVLYSMSASYMPENERFTYVFNGNLQQLDHIFVSPSLYKGMGEPHAPVSNWKDYVFVPHVNSLFSRDRHIQISDHDPIAARIEM